MRVWHALRCDMRLQLRHGFYGAYIFVVLVYVGLLRMLPEAVRVVALPPVLLSEAAIIGFFFAGALLHLERSDGTLQALGMTPLTAGEYILAKMLSLALLNAAAAVAIAVGSGAPHVAPVLLAATAALTGAIFCLAGVAVASRFQRLERFVVWGGLGSALFALPVLPYLGVLPSPLWAVLPTQPALVLLAAGTGTALPHAASPVALALWTALAFVFASRSLMRHTPGWGGVVR